MEDRIVSDSGIQDLPVARVMPWSRAVHGVVAWYPRFLAGRRSLAVRWQSALGSIRLDRAPQIGRMSGIGLILIVGSGVLWLSTIVPMARNVTDLESEIGRLEAAARSGATTIRSPAAQVDVFMKSLPTRSELPAILSAVIAQATEAGLELESGKYEFAPSRSGRIARYRLNFPVRGTYPQLRQFIDGTLVALPAVALEGLRLERKTVGEEVLDAELGFAVIVRGGT
jgi:hypothetical protein